MKDEKLIFWEPFKGIPKQILFLDEWRWDRKGVLITLSDDKNHYILKFKDFTCSFRSSAEHLCWDLEKMYGVWRDENPKINYVWSFFIIQDSDYKDWFKKENEFLDTNIIDSLVHYVIVTEEEIIDVLNDTPPEVTIEKL